jgi:hypothetical protein
MSGGQSAAQPRYPGAEPFEPGRPEQVEPRSFDPAVDARQDGDDPSSEASQPGRHLGPDGDPVEGKP